MNFLAADAWHTVRTQTHNFMIYFAILTDESCVDAIVLMSLSVKIPHITSFIGGGIHYRPISGAIGRSGKKHPKDLRAAAR